MVNLADISGAGTTAALSATNITARWVDFVATGTGTARIGDSTVSASKGIPISAGSGYTTPPMNDSHGSPPYSLGALYAYVPSGCTLSVAYEPYN
jgi:hypothetical protein